MPTRLPDVEFSDYDRFRATQVRDHADAKIKTLTSGAPEGSGREPAPEPPTLAPLPPGSETTPPDWSLAGRPRPSAPTQPTGYESGALTSAPPPAFPYEAQALVSAPLPTTPQAPQPEPTPEDFRRFVQGKMAGLATPGPSDPILGRTLSGAPPTTMPTTPAMPERPPTSADFRRYTANKIASLSGTPASYGLDEYGMPLPTGADEASPLVGPEPMIGPLPTAGMPTPAEAPWREGGRRESAGIPPAPRRSFNFLGQEVALPDWLDSGLTPDVAREAISAGARGVGDLLQRPFSASAAPLAEEWARASSGRAPLTPSERAAVTRRVLTGEEPAGFGNVLTGARTGLTPSEQARLGTQPTTGELLGGVALDALNPLNLLNPEGALGKAALAGLNLAGALPAAEQAADPTLSPEARALMGGMAALGVAGMGGIKPVGKGPTVLRRRGPTPISPTVDTLVDMYSNVPKKVDQSGVGAAERLRRDWVRAWTNRGVDADLLQQQVAKHAGDLTPDEMMAELQRLDPNKAAEVAVQEGLGPAIQRVGDDQPLLSAYLTLTHNLDVARAMGERAESEVLAREIPPSLAQRNATAEKGAQRLAGARKAKAEVEMAKESAVADETARQYGRTQDEIARLSKEADQLRAEREGLLAPSGLIRPDRIFAGWTDAEVMALAEAEQRNPFADDWFDALDPVVLQEFRSDLRGGGKTSRARELLTGAMQAEKELRARQIEATRLEGKMSAALGEKVAKIEQEIAARQTRVVSLEKRADVLRAKAERRRQERAAGRRVEVERGRLFSGGIRAAESEQALQDLRATLEPERMAAIEQSAQEVWDFNQRLLQRRLDAGLISRELYDALVARYPHYSPTVILEHLDAEGARVAVGKKVGISDDGIRRLTEEGTAKVREDPLTSTIRNAHRTEVDARKNAAFGAFGKLVAKDPDLARRIKKPTPGSSHGTDWTPVQGFVDGEKVEFLVPAYLRNAIEQEPIAVIPGIGPVMATWRALVTSKNPLFLTANALVDAGTFMLREMARGGGPQAAPRALVELVKAYADVFAGIFRGEYRGDLARYFKAGGGMGGYTSITPQTGQQALRRLGRRNVFEIKSKADLLRLIKDVVTLEPVAAIGERIEQAPRVASYNLARRRGLSEVEAVIAGRTVTVDFAQGGNWAKVVNQVVPFFNVGIQGGATVVRAAQENPRGFALTALTALVAPTLAAEAWNRADPERARDYADVPQYLKDQGIVIMIPGYSPEDARGNRHPQFVHIRTREFSPFVIATREIAGRALGDEPRGWGDLLMGTLQAVSPIQGSDATSFFSSIVPLGNVGIGTGLQLATNTDWFRNRPIATERADENASPLSRGIAEGLRGLPSGVPVLGGLNQARPSQVEFALRDLGGGPAQMGSEASSALAGRPMASAGPSGVPVVGGALKRFVRGDIGERLQQAREGTLSDQTRRALQAAGVTYRPGPVRGEIEGVALNLDEQAGYQAAVNRYTEEGFQRLFRNPNWQRLESSDREAVAQEVVQAARERAAVETLRKIGPGAIRRRAQDKAGVR